MLDLLKTRRSVRKYTDEMPRDEDIERIVEAGLYAPTGMGRQGVKFVVVKNKEIYHGDRSGSGGHYVYGKHQRCYASATERK